MRRFASVLLVVLGVLPGTAAAHGVVFGDLRGVTLCVESQSVHVRLEGSGAGQALRERLERFLTRALASARVPHRRLARCAEGFIRVNLAATWLEPEDGEALFVYAASVQVGPRPDLPPADPEPELPGGRFYHFDSSLLLASDLADPFEEAALQYAEEMILSLLGSWWEDELERRRALRARLAALGLAGALLALLACWRALRRRRSG